MSNKSAEMAYAITSTVPKPEIATAKSCDLATTIVDESAFPAVFTKFFP
jgi:hypothetical protein